MTTTTLVSALGTFGSFGVGRYPHVGYWELGQGRVAGKSCGYMGLGRPRWGALTPFSAFLQSTNVLYFMGHQLSTNSCPHCARLMSASVLRVRLRAWGRDGKLAWQKPALSHPGPLTSGKCPRQRRALQQGLQDEDGFRMKFACYYPRVEYGQSSCWAWS